MKTKIFLALSLVLCACCSRLAHKTDVRPTPQWITSEEIVDWYKCDRNHRKVLCVLTPYCPGCTYQLKEGWAEILNELDTTQWKRMCVVLVDNDSCAIDEAQDFLAKNGLDLNLVRFQKAYFDTSYFNTIMKGFSLRGLNLCKVEGVPQAFLLDERNNLLVWKTYYTDNFASFVLDTNSNDYNYTPADLCWEVIGIEDFSVPVEGYRIVNKQELQ